MLLEEKRKFKPLKHHIYGGVMMEVVLVTPLVVLVLALVVFFGMSMLRFERCSMMDRYLTWASVYRSPGPDTEAEINHAFMGDDASEIDVDSFKDDSIRALLTLRAAASEQSTECRNYVELICGEFPSGRLFVFKTEHESDIPLFRWMGLSNKHGHRRVDNEWKLVNGITLNEFDKWTYCLPHVTPDGQLNDFFYVAYDDILVELINNNNGYAETVRLFHRSWPGYRGPVVVTRDWNDYP